MVDPKELTPLSVELFVPDVTQATRYYVDTLGFTVLRLTPDDAPIFAIAALGEAVVMFMHDRFYAGTRADLDYRGSGIDIRLMVPNVDAVYDRVRKAGADVMNPIGDREYGLRDFIMIDPFGFRLRFASALT
jgi:uncharacterized glyoxalase superfamily protein PhnB